MSTLIWGTAQIYDINDTLENKIIRFSDNRIGVTWIRNSSDNQRGALYSLSGNSLSYLSEDYETADRYYNTEARLDIAGINSDQSTVAILDNNRYFYVFRLYRSGDQIYVESGGHQPWSIFPPSWPTVCTIDSSNRKIATAWRDVTNNRIRLRVGSYSSDFSSLNWGTVYNVPSSASAAYIKVIQIDTDKFVLVYKRGTSPNRFVYARAITVSGNNINVLGNELQIDNVDNPRFVNCCSPDTDKIAIVWDNNGVDGRVIACSITSTTITKGNKIQFTGNSIRTNACDGLTSDRFIIAYQDFTDSNKGKTVFCKINWSTLSIEYESPVIFSNNSIAATFEYGIGIIKGNSDTVVLTYKDVTDGGKGKIIAGSFEFIPDPPININAVAGNLQNTISWDSSEGATSYNLYYKKDKAPNNYFNNLDDWTDYSQDHASVSIISNKAHFDLEDGYDTVAFLLYDFELDSGDQTITVDISNYSPDHPNSNNACAPYVKIHNDDQTDGFYVYYQNDTYEQVWVAHKVDGVLTSQTKYDCGATPSKIRIVKQGTICKGYVYNGSWFLIDTWDFSENIDHLSKIWVALTDGGTIHGGGSIDFDNLIIEPSVKDSGTKIADVTSPHIHSSLDYDHVYCYEVTAENTTGESDASLEVNATPILPIPDPPTNVNVTPGKIKNTISWDSVLYATKYNLYHLKDKSPNQYFESIDDFTIYKKDGSESATIVSNKCRFDLPDSLDSEIGLRYWDYPISSGDHEIIINFSNYNPDDSDNGFQLHLRFRDNLGTALDFADIYYRTRDISPINLIRGIFRFNGSNNFTTSEFPSVLPTKLRIRRIGTILYVDYYSNETWTNHDSYDFGSRAVNLNTVWIFAEDLDPQYRGGSVDVDDLIIEPSVKNNGTKIADVTSPYIHSDLDNDHVYCYEITAENIKGESSASLEDYGIPEPDIPDIPILDIESGDSENIISIENIKDETEYDIYWSNTPGVTKDNSTKIENIQSPYNHIDLIRQNYYYRCLGRNIYGESELSEEICIKPDFEGKIWNHTERIKQDLLYQYKGD